MKKLFHMVKGFVADENNKIVLKNALGAFAVKGGALLVSLFTTPAFIHYFNDNAVLGVWYTLLSVLTWFLNFDLGIGNGIRNRLVKNFAENDRHGARVTLSSGMFSMLLVTLALILIGMPLITLLDLNSFYNIGSDIIDARTLLISTICVFAGIMLRFFFTTVSSIFYALQKSAVNNFLALLVSILQLLFVLLFNFDTPQQSLLALSIAYVVIANAPMLLAAIFIFLTKLKDCRPGIRFVEKECTKAVMGIGSVFFICQILYMLIMNTNDLLITNIFGPEHTTIYSFYYKLSTIASMLITLAMTPIWSVITKAMAEKNYAWLSKLYRVLKLIAFASILLQFLFILPEQFVMDLWLGDASIQINYWTALAFACFGGVFVYSTILSTIVCGMARMKIQMICYGIGVVVKFVLIFALSGLVNDWSIVVWSNVIILLPYCIIQQIDLDRYIKKQKTDNLKENLL